MSNFEHLPEQDLAEPAPARILVVDDEPLLANAVRRSLSEHQVTTAGGAVEAWQHLEDGCAYDLILCDLAMPEVNGAEFYRRLGEDWPQAQDRVVFMTGGVFCGEMEAFLNALPNPTLTKPFDLTELRELISGMMQSP
mgnify:CR=1 FL=1